jgi:hypothetical protein
MVGGFGSFARTRSWRQMTSKRCSSFTADAVAGDKRSRGGETSTIRLSPENRRTHRRHRRAIPVVSNTSGLDRAFASVAPDGRVLRDSRRRRDRLPSEREIVDPGPGSHLRNSGGCSDLAGDLGSSSHGWRTSEHQRDSLRWPFPARSLDWTIANHPDPSSYRESARGSRKIKTLVVTVESDWSRRRAIRRGWQFLGPVVVLTELTRSTWARRCVGAR